MTPEPDENAAWLTGAAPDEMRRIVDALYRVHRLTAVITDLDTLLERMLDESKAVAEAEASSLMLYEPATEELYFHVALGETGDQQALKREIRLRLGEGIAGAAAETRETINAPDVQKDPRFYRLADETSRFKSRSLLAVPLLDREQLIGVLEVVNKRGGGGFTDVDKHVMEMFSSLAATVIANARLIEENLRAERLAAIGEAVAGLSHYTKNIVNSLTSSIELLDQGLEMDRIDVLRRSWPIFKRSTRRIANFVEDMLAFSKPRPGGREYNDLKHIVNEVVDSFWGLVTIRNITIDVDLDAIAAPVPCDPHAIHRALLNLLVNAAEAVSPPDGRIWVRGALADEGAVAIEVIDNGPGVPDEVRNQIFEPFFSTKGSRGTGLGLAVSQKIVREHGGRLEVHNLPEGGACFRLELPALPPNGDTEE